jgi:hypothetical protein
LECVRMVACRDYYIFSKCNCYASTGKRDKCGSISALFLDVFHKYSQHLVPSQVPILTPVKKHEIHIRQLADDLESI